MIREAARFIVGNGPSSQQDRWEESAGLSPFTVAAEVAALLIAADAAERHAEPGLADYLRDTADAWNDNVDQCLYVRGTSLARHGESMATTSRWLHLRRLTPRRQPGIRANQERLWPSPDTAASEIVSPDALALVRFGLRSAEDPRIVDTVRVIDATLRADLPQGPGWRRYTGDGYGEHADGNAFDGVGIGRVWPLLTGERAHMSSLRAASTKPCDCSRRSRRAPVMEDCYPNRSGTVRRAIERTLLRPAIRCGDAAGVGARGALEARSFPAGRRVFDMPHTPTAGTSRTGSSARGRLATRPTDEDDGVWTGSENRRGRPLSDSLDYRRVDHESRHTITRRGPRPPHRRSADGRMPLRRDDCVHVLLAGRGSVGERGFQGEHWSE